MKNTQKPVTTLICSAIAALMAGHAAHAGSFSLYTESSAAAVGNYGAGIAAEAADASTGWYNPAGLVLLPGQEVVFGGIGVFPNTILTGSSSYHTPVPGFPSLFFPDYVQTFDGINGGKDAFVPSFHYARPLGENVTFGFSMVSPFGLSTDWGLDGPVRYAATNTELMTINASPELGGRLTEHFAVGGGVDFQYAKVKFNRVLGSPAALQGIGEPPSDFDSVSYNTGHSFGLGFHAGVMMMFNDNHSRVGLNYQSQVQHNFNGNSRLHGSLAAPPLLNDPTAVFETHNLYSNAIDLPDVLTLSLYHDINDSLALLASVVYTGWDSLQTIQLYNVAGFVPVSSAMLNSIATEYYSNTWRGALGVNYKYNSKLMFRVGGGYDQTPTNDANRDVRIADTDRWALSVGAHYQARHNLGVDFGYTHLFTVEDVTVNKTEILGSSTYNVTARASGSADLVGLQAVWLLDKEKDK